MFKFVTIYRRVAEEEALEAFFSATHLPLAEALPGLRRSEVSRIQGKPGGASRFHLMYELYFDSEQAYRRALASRPGTALLQALLPWQQAGVVTWFHGESWSEAASAETRAGEPANGEPAEGERPDEPL